MTQHEGRRTRLCTLAWLPGVLQGVADVGPAADGTLQHDGAGHEGRRVARPRLAAPQVDVRLCLLQLACAVAMVTSQHLPLPDL